MITLLNFTAVLDKKQISKGNDYFLDNALEELVQVKPGYWQTEVMGTDLYHVQIQLKETEIISTGCDCPDDEDFCNHVVAVLFALQNELDIEEENNKTLKQKTRKTAVKNKTATLDDVLKQVNEKDLKNFVTEAAKKNKDFRNFFMLRFKYANEAEGYEKYVAMIQDNAKAYSRRGFIDYYESTKALKAALDICDEAETAFDKGNYRITFDASRAIIKEVQAMLNNMDDSNGLAGDCIERSFSCLVEMAVNIDVPVLLRNEIFEYAFTECDKEKYRDFGFDYQMLQLLTTAATDSQQLQQALKKIEAQLDLTESEYRHKELLDTKIELLNKCGRQKEALQIVTDNLQHWEFRELMIKKYIDEKNYEQAKKFAAKAIENEKQKGWQGSSFRWEEWLLTIALKENDEAAIRKYSRHFYFTRFENKYYNIYKATFSAEKWSAECNTLIEWFIKKGRISIPELYALANIYITEKYFDRLLVLLQKNPDYEFAEHCKPFLQYTFESELIAIYRSALLNYAQNNTGRNFYVELRKRLREVQLIQSAKPMIKELVEYFLRVYKNRPAMIDELNKINT